MKQPLAIGRRHKRRLETFIFGLMILCGVSATQSVGQQTEVLTEVAAAPPLPRDGEPAKTSELYLIGPGDVLDISVSKQPDYSVQGSRVDNRGMIQIARDDVEVKAACRTVRDVAAEIKERYKKFLRNPFVYVSVREFNSKPVAVIGAVNAPGRFQLQRQVRLLELLTFVNGPSDRANQHIQVIHTAHGLTCAASKEELEETQIEGISAYELTETLQGIEAANPVVHPGDIVRLPEADQAFLLGNVKNPAPVILKGRVTLTQAIAMAGGLAPGARGDKIEITRQAPGQSLQTEIIASLKDIRAHKSQDIALQPNDIINVPGPSGGKKFLTTIMQTMIPGLIQYPLYVVR